uniref:RNA exonuclease 4 n=1 Tax=Romanomermis culicivorax TaxID=13658 RepID=A0A915IT32_ROMCU
MVCSITKCLAIDCEFVGVGQDGKDDMLARVSIVNLYGDCVYDKYVAPVEEVIDYRTAISGVRQENLVNAEKLKVVQKEVGDLIQGHILVGHNIKKDLQMLFLSHPKKDLRDTSKYRPFRVAARTKWPSLKKLAGLILGVVIQTGEHDSVRLQFFLLFR